MPNPPKPNELKRKLGNPGQRKLPKISDVVLLPMAETIPDSPRPLLVEGQRQWDQIWLGGRSWISPSSDLDHVLLLCETVDERSQLREVVMSGAGDWRDRVALRNLDHQIQSLLSELGFNPVARTRMGVAEVTARSKLEQLRASRNNG